MEFWERGVFGQILMKRREMSENTIRYFRKRHKEEIETGLEEFEYIEILAKFVFVNDSTSIKKFYIDKSGRRFKRSGD